MLVIYKISLLHFKLYVIIVEEANLYTRLDGYFKLFVVNSYPNLGIVWYYYFIIMNVDNLYTNLGVILNYLSEWYMWVNLM
jgi:hypothetical protein